MLKVNRIIIAVAIALFFSAQAEAQTGAKKEPVTPEAAALELAKKYHCFTCHAVEKKVTGPAWKDVSAKYRGDAGAEDRLVKKVAKGGKGVWGNENAMPAFAPHVKEADIRALVKYILSLN